MRAAVAVLPFSPSTKMQTPPLLLRGIVARNRFNPEGSDLPSVQVEYVKDDLQGELSLSSVPVIEWTTDRDQARELPWEEADKLAAGIGFPAHVYTVSKEDSRVQREPRRPRGYVSPEETYSRYEKRGLA